MFKMPTIRVLFCVSIASVLTLVLAVCGSSDPVVTLQRVVDESRVFTVSDLRAAGMKASKQYQVDDLPGGIDAWYGFIQSETGPLDIEVRFYASHIDAAELGTALAEAVSGDDADIDEDTTPWTEGYKDRQRMRSGGSESQQGLRATYLIPWCIGRSVGLGSESSSSAGGGVWKSWDPKSSQPKFQNENPSWSKC